MVDNEKEKKEKERRRRGPGQLPDEAYLVMETTIDDLTNLIKGGEEEIDPRMFHRIDREFRFMMREKMFELRKERTGKP